MTERQRLYFKLIGWTAAYILGLIMWLGIFMIFGIIWFYS